jgi:hypothetical protein
MKRILSIVFALMCLAQPLGAASERPPPAEVVLRMLDEPLPLEAWKRDGFLWDHLANKPEEEKFGSYTSENWRTNFAAFAEALVAKAKEQKLDSVSIRKVLDLILMHSKGEVAYLPVGAYQSTLSGRPVWIFIVKWEYPDFGEAYPPLGHIRIFAFEQKSLEQVGYKTCM